jgi:hypothetical protein
MAPGGQVGATIGETVFKCVYIGKIKNLLKKHWTRKAEIHNFYMFKKS